MKSSFSFQHKLKNHVQQRILDKKILQDYKLFIHRNKYDLYNNVDLLSNEKSKLCIDSILNHRSRQPVRTQLLQDLFQTGKESESREKDQAFCHLQMDKFFKDIRLKTPFNRMLLSFIAVKDRKN